MILVLLPLSEHCQNTAHATVCCWITYSRRTYSRRTGSPAASASPPRYCSYRGTSSGRSHGGVTTLRDAIHGSTTWRTVGFTAQSWSVRAEFVWKDDAELLLARGHDPQRWIHGSTKWPTAAEWAAQSWSEFDKDATAIGPSPSTRGKCEKWDSVEMSLRILDLLPLLSGTPDDQIAWFQRRGLLVRRLNCPSCGLAMHLQTRNDIQDKCR